jgi:hypothetical protein
MNLGPERISGSYQYVLNQNGASPITLGNNSSVNWNAGGVVALTGIQYIVGAKNFDGPVGVGVNQGVTPTARFQVSGETRSQTITVDNQLTINNSFNFGRLLISGYGSGRGYGAVFTNGNDTNAIACRFLNTAGSEVGKITVSGASTIYTTTSDYRLKENIEKITGALGLVEKINPVFYNWKLDETKNKDNGFIAHELKEILPNCVAGEKDAVDENNKILPQSVDYGRLMPFAIAGIQELKEIIDSQNLRISELESKLL